jgi:hypothetical protein
MFPILSVPGGCLFEEQLTLWHPRQLSVNKALLAGATASGLPKSPNLKLARRQTD